MYGTPADSSAARTRRTTASALSPDTVELPDELLTYGILVQVRHASPDACASHLSNRITHQARDEDFSRTAQPTMNGSENFSCFGGRVLHRMTDTMNHDVRHLRQGLDQPVVIRAQRCA